MEQDFASAGILGISHTNKQITVVLSDGTPKSVSSDEAGKFEKILTAIKEKRFTDVVDLINIFEKSVLSDRLKIDKGVAFIDNQQLPKVLSDKLIDFVNQGVDVDYLVAFWDNLIKNPSFRSVQQLYSFLEKNNHAFTPDGCFIAYKRVRSDFKDIHSGQFDNSVGATVEVRRNEVDEDPEKTCSFGLHVANYDYAANIYGNRAVDILLLVKVNPADVVAIPVDYHESKMRVCKYVVLSVVKEEIKNTNLISDEQTPRTLRDSGYTEQKCYCNDPRCYCDNYDEDYDDEEDCDYDDDLTNAEILSLIDKDPFFITAIERPTEEQQIRAVTKDPWVLEALFELCEGNGFVVTDNVILAAVKQDPYIIEIVEDLPDSILVEAVKIDPEVVLLLKK